MGKQQQIETITDLQNAVKNLWTTNGCNRDEKQDLYRDKDQSQVKFGDFFITKERFIKEFGSDALNLDGVIENKGLIRIPTPF